MHRVPRNILPTSSLTQNLQLGGVPCFCHVNCELHSLVNLTQMASREREATQLNLNKYIISTAIRTKDCQIEWDIVY